MNTINPKRIAGAPKKMEDGKRTTLYISKITSEQALRIGNNNVSEGIRIATSLTDGLPLKLRYILHALIENNNHELLKKVTNFILEQK